VTIGPGTAWSAPGVLPADAPVFSSDRALSEAVSAARLAGVALPVVGLTGGTLWTTIGGPSVEGRLRTGEARHYPVDVGVARLDGKEHVFIGSVLARRRSWREVVAVMNTPFLGRRRVAPRAHPGDALLDLIEGDNLRADDLRRILPRTRTGSHLPHPKLRERRLATASWRFDRPRSVWVDGHRAGRVRQLDVRLEADALVVVV
jgi:YegS C-terminal NAD kinase beta sandwich-like domain